jgi:hypothetical protein
MFARSMRYYIVLLNLAELDREITDATRMIDGSCECLELIEKQINQIF